MTTTVPVSNVFSVNIATLLNQNQSLTNTSVPLTVTNHTLNTPFILFVRTDLNGLSVVLLLIVEIC